MIQEEGKRKGHISKIEGYITSTRAAGCHRQHNKNELQTKRLLLLGQQADDRRTKGIERTHTNKTNKEHAIRKKRTDTHIKNNNNNKERTKKQNKQKWNEETHARKGVSRG